MPHGFLGIIQPTMSTNLICPICTKPVGWWTGTSASDGSSVHGECFQAYESRLKSKQNGEIFFEASYQSIVNTDAFGLGEYQAWCRELSRPTAQQIVRFVEHVGYARSWRTKMPFLSAGPPLWLFFSPTAHAVKHRDGPRLTKSHEPVPDSHVRYSRNPDAQRLQQEEKFGLLGYWVPVVPMRRLDNGSGFECEIRGGYHFPAAVRDGSMRPLPDEIIYAGQVFVTSSIIPYAGAPPGKKSEWYHSEYWDGAWPEESGGEAALALIRDVFQEERVLSLDEVRRRLPFAAEPITWRGLDLYTGQGAVTGDIVQPPLGTAPEVGAALAFLFALERRRQYEQMFSTIQRMLDLLFDKPPGRGQESFPADRND